MKIVYGDIWDYPADVVVITTNGSVKQNGAAVMGRGVALQAKQRYPGIDHIIGRQILASGLSVHLLNWGNGSLLMTFPVKYKWREKADVELIRKSAKALSEYAALVPNWVFVLPRPGCGNGGLTWGEVLPVIEPLLPDNVRAITFPDLDIPRG